MNKKVFPILIACIFILSCGFYFFSKSPAAYVERALEQMKTEEYLEADKTLDALERDHPSYPVDLYKGYLAQSRKKFKEADRHFQMLIDYPAKEVSLDELCFARAANAYFEGRDVEFIQLVKTGEECALDSSRCLFFQGLLYYLNERYSDALEVWSPFLTSSDFLNVDWQQAILNKLFPEQWIEIHIAHCLFEEGDIGGAQQILEKNLHPEMENKEQSDFLALSYLFLAMASVKEAHLLPITERSTEYKLARFYFDRATIPGHFYREKNRAILALQAEIKSLLQTFELREWGISFLHLLEEWKAEAAIEDIAETAANGLVRGDWDDVAFCDLLEREFQETFFHSLLIEKLIDRTSQSISSGQCKTMQTLWGTLQRLSSNPKEIATKMSLEISEEIFHAVHQDSDSLEHTLGYLDMWKQLERDPARHFHFALSLIGHGEMLWKKEGHEKKGTRLMEISLALVEEHERLPLLKHIEHFLINLYREAESANMVRRLSLIYDALAFFNLGSQSLASPASLANHLADADYLFRARHYASAQTHAEWVLKFEPMNLDALRLYGLSSFHLGDYKRAMLTLKKLPNPDENCRKALILSKAFSSQPQDQHLAQHEPEEEATNIE